MGNGRELRLDEEDYEAFGQYRWFAYAARPKCVYAFRSTYDRETKKSSIIGIHREIMQPEGRITVDHEDGDGLNNRRYNLRAATYKQNGDYRPSILDRNRGLPRGVYEISRGRYQASISLNNKTISLGQFDTIEEAARAWDSAAVAARGQFTYLNFPPNAVSVA